MSGSNPNQNFSAGGGGQPSSSQAGQILQNTQGVSSNQEAIL